jgi:hypothetical protein
MIEGYSAVDCVAGHCASVWDTPKRVAQKARESEKTLFAARLQRLTGSRPRIAIGVIKKRCKVPFVGVRMG